MIFFQICWITNFEQNKRIRLLSAVVKSGANFVKAICAYVATSQISPRGSDRLGRGLPAADATGGVRPLRFLLRLLRPQPHHIGGDPLGGDGTGRPLFSPSAVVAAVVAGVVVILGVGVAVGADAVDDRARRGGEAARRRGRGRGAVLHFDAAREVSNSG